MKHKLQPDLYAAFWKTIQPGLDSWYALAFVRGRVVCELTGAVLTPDVGCIEYLDTHYTDLLDNFLSWSRADTDRIQVKQDGGLLHEDLANLWVEFFWHNAHLRIVLDDAHLFYTRESTPAELAFRKQIHDEFIAAGYTQIYPLGEQS